MVAHMPAGTHSRIITVICLGIVQILAFGSSFYFPAVLAAPIAADTGWPLSAIVGGVSIGLLTGGLISPKIGTLIGRHDGRPVLAASSLLFAFGLAAIGLAPSVPFYFAAWVVVGLGMGAGLYDAAFAALGKRYGQAARGPITHLTLFGGFASTVCWPLSAFLVESVGWRGTCFVYAALHLFVALPLVLYALRPLPTPAEADDAPAASDTMSEADSKPTRHHETAMLILIALILSIAAGVGAIIVVHLLIILQARGLDFAAAVALGTLFGPAQVGARMIESLAGTRYHPIWTLAASVCLMAIGLLLLLPNWPVIALAVILYAAGYGISWIARGTLPLAIFGAARFPTLMGRIAMPSLIVQALAPAAGALAIEHIGIAPTLAILLSFALVNIALVIALALRLRAA
jgi:predicted MFS family arabinose efflux permease